MLCSPTISLFFISEVAVRAVQDRAVHRGLRSESFLKFFFSSFSFWVDSVLPSRRAVRMLEEGERVFIEVFSLPRSHVPIYDLLYLANTHQVFSIIFSSSTTEHTATPLENSTAKRRTSASNPLPHTNSTPIP